MDSFIELKDVSKTYGSGPAASAQARVLYLINDCIGLHGESLLHGFVAVQFEVAIDVRRALSKALRDDLYFVGMGNERSH